MTRSIYKIVPVINDEDNLHYQINQYKVGLFGIRYYGTLFDDGHFSDVGDPWSYFVGEPVKSKSVESAKKALVKYRGEVSLEKLHEWRGE